MKYVDNPFKSPVVISMCTGSGMLEDGLQRAIGSITAAAYVEIEAFACYNMVAKMEKGLLAPAPIWTDVKTFPASLFRGRVHGITAGYPCQPFSIAGAQRGTDDPRHLYPYISAHINTIRPAWCFFENVPGHLRIGFQEVKHDLQSMGYRVEAGLYSAQEVGASHVRERLYVLAVENAYYAGVRGCACEVLQRWLYTQTEGSGAMEYANETGREQLRQSVTTAPEFCAAKYDGDVANTTGAECEGEWDYLQSLYSRYRRIARSGARWPAAPGQEQYEWEAPRIVESGMGCTINGYNYREDLLRMYGNGVVPATCEHAIIHLLTKHAWNAMNEQR